MQNKELKDLLEKFKNQSCTHAELKFLRNYFSDEKYEEQIKELLIRDISESRIDDEAVSKVNFEEIYNQINNKISENSMKFGWDNRRQFVHRRSIIRIMKIAAVLILFFTAGGFFTYLIYAPHYKEPISFNEIKVPLGARSEVILPDGSNVWLNAGSTICYSNIFNKKNRQVFLTGEAYFKVNKNTELPFTVITGDLNIIATGTEFNVKAYDDEGIIETTLITGKVEIHYKGQTERNGSSDVTLEPSQKAVYVKKQQELRIEEIRDIMAINPGILNPQEGNLYVASRIDPAPIIAWKNNKLIFKGEELVTLAVKLERKYNMSIRFRSDEVKHFRFTGTLEDETITQVLDVIKLTAPIDYELKGKEVVIFENTKMRQKFIRYLKHSQEK
jgi:transmembrane sensor